MQFLIISLLFVVLERLLPERREQTFGRRGIVGDILHWVFNGYIFYLGYSIITGLAFEQFTRATAAAGLDDLLGIRFLTGKPLWMQFIILFLVQDFLMWFTHYLLHRVPFLWSFHRVHHSITTMDWIGNMRYHWGEIVVYNSVMFLPLMLLGADPSLFVYINIFNTFIGHFNHSNLRVDIGPLKYLFNSPQMHIWHHDRDCPAPYGRNFAIGLSLWDWMFRTGYLPGKEEPKIPRALGFDGLEEFPKTFLGQQLHPCSKIWKRTAFFSLLFLGIGIIGACDVQAKKGDLMIDTIKKTVTFTGTIHPGQFNSWKSWPKHHHFIVWKGGRASRNALIEADVSDIEVQRALESLGAVPGDNLTLNSWEKRKDRRNPDPDLHVEGTPVGLAIAWQGHAPIAVEDIFVDKGGKGFEFRFGGHEKFIPEWKSGCIVCLESCPGGRISNARYTLRDFENEVARFDVRKEKLPKDGTVVTVTLSVKR
jgi:sterol desaturase/sphingolipid hydroxylase (fatty acid hydroxylase superfamily)